MTPVLVLVWVYQQWVGGREAGASGSLEQCRERGKILVVQCAV